MAASIANGWIIVCPLGAANKVDALGDSTLYIEFSDKKAPERPSDGTMRDTLASGWFVNAGPMDGFGAQPWYPYRNRIGRVAVLDPWSPESGRYLFDGLGQCAEFDVLKLDTSRCETLEGMFRGCSMMTQMYETDRFDTSRVKSVADMFLNCLSLKAVSIAGWDVSGIEEAEGMMAGCSAYVLASAGQSEFLKRVAGRASTEGIWRRSNG